MLSPRRSFYSITHPKLFLDNKNLYDTLLPNQRIKTVTSLTLASLPLLGVSFCYCSDFQSELP